MVRGLAVSLIRPRLLAFAAFGFSLLLPIHADIAAQESVTAFVNVSVVPMDREHVLLGQTVLVRNGRITEIGAAAKVRVPSSATRIDGTGKFLMPGLGDMHAHVAPAGHVDQMLPDSVAEQILFLFLANGITTIRNMNGNPRHLVFRERIAKGELLGPRIYTAGPGLMADMSPDAIAKAIAEQKAAGYDLIKVVTITSEGFDTAVAAARRAGMSLAGHVSHKVGIERALRAPYASIEHMEGYVKYLLPPDVVLSGKLSPQGNQENLEALKKLDRSKTPPLLALVNEAGVWNCPTLAAIGYLGLGDEVVQKPSMQYVSGATAQSWAMLTRILSPQAEARRQIFQEQVRVLKALRDAGGRLLLGDDAMAPYMVPGFSIHEELQALVAAGLTPYQALESGTRNVATFLGTLDSTGTIAVGKRADLVLLNGNPLADIRHTAEPAGVMMGGRWLSRTEIDQRLATMKGTI